MKKNKASGPGNATVKKESNHMAPATRRFPSGAPRPQPVPEGYRIKIPEVARCSKCGRQHVSWRACDGRSKAGKEIDTRPGCMR